MAARDALAELHGEYEHGEGGSVLDSLVRTMLSQNTTDVTSAQAFRQLKQRFPRWEQCLVAKTEEVAEEIKICGLGDIRASRIKSILSKLQEERGEVSLEYVRPLDDEAIKVGP